MLAPEALILLAKTGGCDAVAITDHDTVAALSAARVAAAAHAIKFVAGVEISVTYNYIDRETEAAGETTLHIVGLNIDETNANLLQLLSEIRAGRITRAAKIAEDLNKVGVFGTFEGATAMAENKEMIGRTHFARHLVERGIEKNVGRVFNKYLAKGKPGYVAHEWTSLEAAVATIHMAGGLAVIAHPGRYRVSPTVIRDLFGQFKALGGDAIEVITGSHKTAQFQEYTKLALEFDFMASRGADFHALGESPFLPGSLPPLSSALTPVWTKFNN
jgi:3',5'-nucleoside bisphosphate phosphatase